nr:hypothetical protein [Pontixanthobacter aquaemixtae]
MGLVSRIQPALQALVMRGNAGGAGVLVALHRLNASQGKHEPAGRRYEIRTGAQRPCNVAGSNKLARGDDPDAVLEAVPVAQIDQHGQRLAQRQPDIVDQRHRGGAGPAVPAINRDEIGRRCASPLLDQVKQLVEPGMCPDHGFETDRFAGHAANMRDHVEQIFAIGNLRVAIGGNRILALGNAANLRNFAGHFRAGQNAAFPRFRPLRELQFDHSDLFMRRHFAQLFIGQAAIGIAHAIFGRAELEDDIAAPFKMMRRQTAFAGIQPASGNLCSLRQRAYSRGRNGPETHRRNVEQRGGVIGFRAMRADLQRRGSDRVAVQCWPRIVDENGCTHGIEIAGRAKRHGVPFALGGAIDPFALRPVERHFLAVHRKEILAEEFAQLAENGTQPPDDGVIAAHGILRLSPVDDVEHRQYHQQNADSENEDVGKQIYQIKQGRLPI